MLKGTTKIELTDVNTGETQVIEKHNAITGALQEIFNPVLGHLTEEEKLIANLPAYTSLLGGLLLFDGRIEGDPLPLYAPDNVKLVGCARYNYANTLGSVYMGSYDNNESVISPQTKMAKLVYNFTQSQANGTINSVCLTHRAAGFGAYRNDIPTKSASTKLANSVYATPTTKLIRNNCDRMYGIRSIGNDEYLFAVDIDNDIGHYLKLTSSTTIVMVKRRLGIKQYSMFGSVESLIEESAPIVLATGIKCQSSTTNYNAFNFDPETNALYILHTLPTATNTTLAAGAQFVVTKIVLGETVATQKTLTNTHSTGILLHTGYVYRGKAYAVGPYTAATVNGRSGHIYPVVSFDVESNAVATHGTIDTYASSTYNVRSMFAMDGRLYWQGHYDNASSGLGALRVTDCTATPDATNTTYSGVAKLLIVPR